MARLVAGALRVLLARSIDYAGLFPPASLPMERAARNYRAYAAGEFAWMLRRFVVSEKDLADLAVEFLARREGGSVSEWNGALSVLSERDCEQAGAIETKQAIAFSKPTYCETAFGALDDVVKAGGYAKVRTGGVTVESILPVETLARFIHACAQRRLPFKATAGLHHPIRSTQALTYEADSILTKMHGFINFLMASAFAWRGESLNLICEVLDDTDATSFHFGETAACWRNRSLDVELLKEARRDFVHSFGSCSFTDPVDGLRSLGWL